jgi:hypothetical protein
MLERLGESPGFSAYEGKREGRSAMSDEREKIRLTQLSSKAG